MCSNNMYGMISIWFVITGIINSYSLLHVHTDSLLKGEETGEFCSIMLILVIVYYHFRAQHTS